MATTADRPHKTVHASTVARDTTRVQAFSDGVFAIAITLLILEIKVPRPASPSEPFSLLQSLLGLWPSYFAYVLSFVTIGIYWARHHYIFMLYQRTDYVFKLLNLLFLMWISFLPFPTDVLATYLSDSAHHDPLTQQTAVTFYAIGLFLPAASRTLMWLYASRARRLVDPRLQEGFMRRITTGHVRTVVLYARPVLLSLVDYRLRLALCVGLTLVHLLPPRAPVYVRKSA